MIVVTGATGTIGRTLIRLLTGRGETVRAVSRKPPAAPAGGPGAVQWVTADLCDPGSLDGVADGADAVFLLPSGAEAAEQAASMLACAERAGAGRIVSISALSAGHGLNDPISSWHRAAEDVLRAGAVPWCVLRPNGFMTNTLNWADSIRQGGPVYAPFGDGRTSVIDPADIAACAAECLLRDGHAGRAYDLTGPQALSNEEQVQAIGRAVGRDLRYVPVPRAAAREWMAGSGMPAALADAVLDLLATAETELGGLVTQEVEAITGRPATSFADWAQVNAASFR